MSTSSTRKSNTAGSQTWGSAVSDTAKGSSSKRRRTKLVSEKKIADDEFMAAAIGDVEWLKQSLKDSGPDCNYDKNGLTAIHLSAIHGRLECLKVCIEKFKIDVNLPSSTGWRAVHLCISNQTGKRSTACLMYLLEKGADHSIPNDDGITPVHQAASEGHVHCMKLLIEVGARLDKKDCRGNTPLDLAKLWGHRKCARILAAEMWHQDKDNVSKEMHQLKKVKMQQVLKDLEAEEEQNAAKQFYGEEAFEQWMANKNLSKTPDKVPDKKGIKDSVYKPNSVVRKTEESKNSQPLQDGMKLNIQAQEKEEKRELTDEELLKGLLPENERDNDSNQDKTKKIGPPFYNENPWNKSTKIPKIRAPYIPHLSDDYPRNEYTIMPQVKGAPKFYEGKFVRPMTPSNIDDDVMEKGTETKLRKPRLPKEVVKKVMAKDASAIDRGMLFKCKHIGDVHTKKKYDVDEKGRPEAPLHLTNDVKSQMVKQSVRILNAGAIHLPKKSNSRDSKTSGIEWMSDDYPLPMVMNTLRNMSKMSQPTHFMNPSCDEYLFAFKT